MMPSVASCQHRYRSTPGDAHSTCSECGHRRKESLRPFPREWWAPSTEFRELTTRPSNAR